MSLCMLSAYQEEFTGVDEMSLPQLNDSLILGLVKSDTIVAFCIISYNVLAYMITFSCQRGKGFGKTMFLGALSYLHHNTQIQALTLECQRSLLPFYEREGARLLPDPPKKYNGEDKLYYPMRINVY
jgi:hypothetical protein